jgi:hypothetical protein
MKLSLLFLLFSNFLFAQRNNVFSVGFDPAVNITFDKIIAFDTFFNTQQYLPRPIMAYSGSNICDTNGNLLLMSNGFSVYNNKGFGIKNWEEINCPFGNAFRNDPSILLWNQMSTIIPRANNQYYVFTSGMSNKAYAKWKTGTTQDDLFFDFLCYHVVDMNANNGDGEVISKNNVIMQNAFLCYDKMACVQHGNGHDWWLIKPHKKKHLFYKFLISDASINLVDSTAYNYPDLELNQIRGQSVFSEDGTQYAFVSENWKSTENYIYYYHFDRCSGHMSNYRRFSLPLMKDSMIDKQNGVAFSPNGRFLYVSSSSNIWQIDLTNSDNNNYVRIAGPDIVDSIYGNEYLTLKLGPDNKIYVGNGNGNNYRCLSYINQPNEFGLACDFKLRGLCQNLTYMSIPPNNPKYDMGALAGSPCDTIRAQPSNWVLYPNPATDNIIIKVPNSTTSSVVSINIYDMLGKLVSTQNLPVNFVHEAVVVLPAMARGVYVVKAVLGSGKFVGRFVRE